MLFWIGKRYLNYFIKGIFLYFVSFLSFFGFCVEKFEKRPFSEVNFCLDIGPIGYQKIQELYANFQKANFSVTNDIIFCDKMPPKIVIIKNLLSYFAKSHFFVLILLFWWHFFTKVSLHFEIGLKFSIILYVYTQFDLFQGKNFHLSEEPFSKIFNTRTKKNRNATILCIFCRSKTT